MAEFVAEYFVAFVAGVGVFFAVFAMVAVAFVAFDEAVVGDVCAAEFACFEDGFGAVGAEYVVAVFAFAPDDVVFVDDGVAVGAFVGVGHVGSLHSLFYVDSYSITYHVGKANPTPTKFPNILLCFSARRKDYRREPCRMIPGYTPNASRRMIRYKVASCSESANPR